MRNSKKRRKLKRGKPRSKEPEIPVEKPKPKPNGLSFVKKLIFLFLYWLAKEIVSLVLAGI